VFCQADIPLSCSPTGSPGELAISPSRINGEPLDNQHLNHSFIAGVPGVGSILSKNSDGRAALGNRILGLQILQNYSQISIFVNA